MPRTLTRYVDFAMFETRGQSSIPVIRLMMACNDIQVANESQKTWQERRSTSNRERVHGAAMYFVRLQWAHLHEGLKAIRAIANDPVLMMIVNQCDSQTRESFDFLIDYAPGGAKEVDFYRQSGMVRDNVTFHYNDHTGKNSGKLIRRAIGRRSGSRNGKRSSVTRSDTAYRWHFKLADDIVETIVVREIWGITAEHGVQPAADSIVGDIYAVFERFVDFSGEFIWRYCER